MPRPALRALPVLLALAVTIVAAPSANAAMKPAARKFIAQHQRIYASFAPKQATALATTARMGRELKACPPMSDLPHDGFEQIKSFLYVLQDLIQETSAPFTGDIAKVANEYKNASYGDPVLNRAAHARYRHLKTISELKPLDSCQIITDWAAAGWPTSWEPSGAAYDATRALYNPDLQIPDEAALHRRLRKLGASKAQVARIGHPVASEKLLDAWDKADRALFPLAGPEWLQWR